MTHALTSADISIFFEKSLNFATLRNTAIDCILLHNLSYFNFFRVFKDFLNKNGYNLDDVSKIGYSRPSWNIGILK